MRRLKYWQAISEATVQCMEADPSIFVAGIGVDDFKAVFGTTAEAYHRFGGKRVFDIPNSENAMTGIAIGAAAMGKRPLVVHPRNDFMFLCMDQAAEDHVLLGGQPQLYTTPARRRPAEINRFNASQGWKPSARS
jgi:pyruvate/2-oxoglutarate/acetoin dehydrogenase E1 component